MMTMGELADLLPGARLAGEPAVEFVSVSTDTRTLGAGALFVALKGERFDAHDFAAEALGRGAAGALVERPLAVPLPQVVVADARRALGLLASAWRGRFRIPLIAVTGSNGKTTVTQMIAGILAQAWGEEGRLATRGNLNNDIGLPLTLLRLGPEHRVGVVELGMNHPGEIGYLAGLARPTVALVNNAQREHQEFMASAEATATENGSVLAALPPDGVAVFPADDPCAPIWRELAGRRRVVDFARRGPAAVTAVWEADPQGTRLEMATPAGSIAATVRLGGEHAVHNALAAAACTLAAGLAPEAVAAGLAAFTPLGGRGTVFRTPSGACLVDDTYNANPDSVRAAIDQLAGYPEPRVLVLGDMGEVGARGPDFHREVGLYARDRGVVRLLALGPLTRESVAAFGSGGRHFEDVEGLKAAALAEAVPGVTVLVKGSRFMRMERVVVALREAAPAPASSGTPSAGRGSTTGAGPRSPDQEAAT